MKPSIGRNLGAFNRHCRCRGIGDNAMITCPIRCPICRDQGKTSYSRRLDFDLRKRKAQFQCNEDPAHKFELDVDEINKSLDSGDRGA